MGAYADLGADPRADMYEIEFFIDGLDGGTALVGQTIDLYMAQSNSTTEFDGAPSTAPTDSTQGTITADQARNLLYIGSLSAYSTTESDNLLRGRFVARLTSRYVAPVVVNRINSPPDDDGDYHYIRLTPIPIDMQPDP
jgi:hypothetical protein